MRVVARKENFGGGVCLCQREIDNRKFLKYSQREKERKKEKKAKRVLLSTGQQAKNIRTLYTNKMQRDTDCPQWNGPTKKTRKKSRFMVFWGGARPKKSPSQKKKKKD